MIHDKPLPPKFLTPSSAHCKFGSILFCWLCLCSLVGRRRRRMMIGTHNSSLGLGAIHCSACQHQIVACGVSSYQICRFTQSLLVDSACSQCIAFCDFACAASIWWLSVPVVPGFSFSSRIFLSHSHDVLMAMSLARASNLLILSMWARLRCSRHDVLNLEIA
jgi:hypothetical protein